MSHRRHVRELAIQALYQLDARGPADIEHIERSILDAPHAQPVKEQAIELANLAWQVHEQADAIAAELAPDWPTHRQPPVDRSIIRLAYYEMASNLTPVAVAINEAVEIAKSYSTDRSASFINGVLDKMAKHLRQRATEAPAPAPTTTEAWLHDAITEPPPAPPAPPADQQP